MTMPSLQTPLIAVVRESNVITDALVKALIPALQTQIVRDFVPRWGGAGGQLMFFRSRLQAPKGAYLINLLDNTDQAEALGYHDLDHLGVPYSNVYVADCLRFGLNWSVTVSHELLEMVADPYIDQTVKVVHPNGDVYEYAKEVCDAPEDDIYAYPIHGHMMSAFMTPAWFDPTAAGPYSFPPVIEKPLQILRGGYIGLRINDGDWTQSYAQGVRGARTFKAPESRTLRRFAKPLESQVAVEVVTS